MPDNLQYKNVIRKSLDLLSKKEKQKLSFITMLQIISSFLDLLGIAVVGVLGAITVIGFGSGQPGDRVSLFLSFLHLNDSSLQTQALTLGLLAASILVLKTILSVWFTRRTLFFSVGGVQVFRVL